ncbi:excinuclease ABC subunit UvrA [Planctomycetota bacterium]
MDDQRFIRVRGAREHNLKEINVDIPRDQMTVITGLSGSGKSSLAFDTIYAEGQRRYMESLSSYARQFLEQIQKPDVEFLEGLPPTIAIQQRAGSSNPRSTVATTTEIYDYLRVLFARAGTPYCHRCKIPIERQSPQLIVDRIVLREQGTKIMILSPVVRGRKGAHQDVLDWIRREGYLRTRIDGLIVEPANVSTLAKTKKHDIDVVIDRLVIKKGMRARLTDSIETALKISEGLVTISQMDAAGDWTDETYSEFFACPQCSLSIPELTPRMFSFNSPYGACEACDGLGLCMELDEDLIVPDKTLPVKKSIVPWRRGGKRMNLYYARVLRGFGRYYDIDIEQPFNSLTSEQHDILMHGAGSDKTAKGRRIKFEGVIPDMLRRFHNTDSEYVKNRIHAFMNEKPCEVCNGARLRSSSRSVLIDKKNICDVTALSIEEAYGFFNTLRLGSEEEVIATPVLKEIVARLGFLNAVGLGYITLDRKSSTLSGGEAQRIRLASQVGNGLVGVCYVLDEPTIGLHPKDNHRLLKTLRQLSDMGNTVIVVEHDRDTIAEADYLVDIGPAAGEKGGEVIYQGEVDGILSCDYSLTGKYLSGELSIAPPQVRRRLNPVSALQVLGARENNLKNIDVSFPLGGLVCVTGVSGSGKSTLVNDILFNAIMRRLHSSRNIPGKHRDIAGLDLIDKVIDINQSPIGRTPRSNPATYTGVFDEIRKLFAKTKDAKLRGYKPGRFSFNIKGGRCEACLGQGTKRIEMHFLPDVFVMCEACKGKRFNNETLEIRYRGVNISNVLEMTVEEAFHFFSAFPKIIKILETLRDVGLGYIHLGQSCTTLSGGEAQRIKLATELCKRSTGKTLYILDEPTTGLHFEDIHKLLHVLNCLVDMGNSVIVIEHNPDITKMADWIIDMGPDGGSGGGRVVATGSPEDICKIKRSYTGQYMKNVLGQKQIVWRPDTTKVLKKGGKDDSAIIRKVKQKIKERKAKAKKSKGKK